MICVLFFKQIQQQMFNSRVTIGCKARQSNAFKVSLGNAAPRYNSQVSVQRKKYLMSSVKNSEDAPDWMSRTQSYHYRGSNRNRSLHMNPASPFKQVEQTYVYAGLTRAVNPQSNFNRVVKSRQRSKWEMKGHTFEYEWPRAEGEVRRQMKVQSQLGTHQSVSTGFRNTETSRWQMPKYGYFESPLHVQKETPIKIGHPYLLNSTYIK